MAVNLGKKMKAAVLYHYPCPDGAFAALAAHLYFSASSLPALFFPNTVYNPIRTEQLPVHELSHVYLLDFVGPCGFVDELSSKVDRVVVLDHHKTALDMLGRGDETKKMSRVIDMDRSGATIAYDYFREKLAAADLSVERREVASRHFERLRRMFEYIEDGDLWRWSLPHSKAFSSGLKDLNLQFSIDLNPRLFDQLLSLDLDSIIAQGMKSLSHKQELIEGALGQAYEIALGGGKFGRCLAVDADALSDLRSELGHQLAAKSLNQKLRGIAAIVYRVPELENDQVLKVSLRSVSSEDTTPISQEFGGGGHKNASSFMLTSAEFNRWKVNPML